MAISTRMTPFGIVVTVDETGETKMTPFGFVVREEDEAASPVADTPDGRFPHEVVMQLGFLG